MRSRRQGSRVPGSRRFGCAGLSVSGANFRRSKLREAWRYVRGQRPPARGPGPGPRPAPGSHPLRSRSRSPLSPGSRRGAASQRREAPERPGLEDTEPSDSGRDGPASHGGGDRLICAARSAIVTGRLSTRSNVRQGSEAGTARRPCAAGWFVEPGTSPCPAAPGSRFTRHSRICRADRKARPWRGRASPPGRDRPRPGAVWKPGRGGERSRGAFS